VSWSETPEGRAEMAAAVYGTTPGDRCPRFKRRWFNKHVCRKCGYPSGWHTRWLAEQKKRPS
jgi:hypothetical protein